MVLALCFQSLAGFDKVGAPVSVSGWPLAATNIPVVHTLLMAIQATFDLEPEES